MGNMAYCRFQNTLQDLEECYDSWDDDSKNLSPEETKARARLIKVCGNIWAEYGDGD